MTRRKKLTYLTHPEFERFMKAATEVAPHLLRSAHIASMRPFPRADGT
jgi:hypothetical protein